MCSLAALLIGSNTPDGVQLERVMQRSLRAQIVRVLPRSLLGLRVSRPPEHNVLITEDGKSGWTTDSSNLLCCDLNSVQVSRHGFIAIPIRSPDKKNRVYLCELEEYTKLQLDIRSPTWLDFDHASSPVILGLIGSPDSNRLDFAFEFGNEKAPYANGIVSSPIGGTKFGSTEYLCDSSRFGFLTAVAADRVLDRFVIASGPRGWNRSSDSKPELITVRTSDGKRIGAIGPTTYRPRLLYDFRRQLTLAVSGPTEILVWRSGRQNPARTQLPNWKQAKVRILRAKWERSGTILVCATKAVQYLVPDGRRDTDYYVPQLYRFDPARVRWTYLGSYWLVGASRSGNWILVSNPKSSRTWLLVADRRAKSSPPMKQSTGK